MLELGHEGYEVHHVADGREGWKVAKSEKWDLILLDIMLPQLNGLEILRRIRQVDSTVPIILLTARDSIPDKVSGLDYGANDYVTKPFSIEELLARIRGLLRQTKIVELKTSPTLHISNLTLDSQTRIVTRDQQSIELTTKEYELLYFLLQNKGTVMSREQILSDVWGYEFIGDTNTVDVYIRYLRQKIDRDFEPKLIHTVRGVGYVLQDSNQ
ncbi:DNA-binding response regulator [Ammoniphilus oxalaticus]|uniref:DNA-binding response regulator n=1 Tax=Ammoniphilus oxalaticus TaxID=66863 RepID=A0A419SD96_9BACL|nr:DNA-binding response regulator [Ammoniphilus oxalaticus]